jgi:hypothetical protein
MEHFAERRSVPSRPAPEVEHPGPGIVPDQDSGHRHQDSATPEEPPVPVLHVRVELELVAVHPHLPVAPLERLADPGPVGGAIPDRLAPPGLSGTIGALATRHATLLITCLAVLLALSVYRDYGVTFDEGAQAAYGERALAYYGSGGSDLRATDFYNLHYYGPLVEMVVESVARIAPLPRYDARHLALGVLACLGIPAAIAFAGLGGRRSVALLTGVILLALPRFSGHAFNNSKDIPFAIAFTFFMYATTRMFIKIDYSWRSTLLVGLGFGLALTVRPGGFILLGAFFFVISFMTRIDPALKSSLRAAGPDERKLRSRRTMIALGLGVLLTYAAWPWGHHNPLVAFPAATSVSLSLPRPIPVLFEGEVASSALIPWYYLPKMLVITTPLAILGLFLIGVGIALRSTFSPGRAEGERAQLRAHLMIALVWVGMPIALFLIRRPSVYDGIRHFLFLLPCIAYLAAVGAVATHRLIASRVGSVVALLIVGGALIPPAVAVARLHPYQITYYNSLVGGVAGGAREYDSDYWLSGYGEAMKWINDRSSGTGGPVEVLMAGFPLPGPDDLLLGAECWTDRRPPPEQVLVTDFLKAVATHAAAEHVQVVTLPELWDEGRDYADVDFYLATTRWGYDECLPDAPVVRSIGRAGATFVVVKQVGDGPIGQ